MKITSQNHLLELVIIVIAVNAVIGVFSWEDLARVTVLLHCPINTAYFNVQN